MTSAAILELHFFPCQQWFSKLLIYDRVLIEAHETYQKGSYRNRCYILGPNGKQRLSLPLKSGKNSQKITEVLLAYDEPWEKQLWRSIKTAYGSAPFFPYYAERIRESILNPGKKLFSYSTMILETLMALLQIPESRLEMTEDFKQVVSEEGITDLRNNILPLITDTDPNWIALPYEQVFQDRYPFEPNLSMLDLLFCKGPESLLYLEQCILAARTAQENVRDH